jgi:CRISPR type III-A-associated protein Csm2
MENESIRFIDKYFNNTADSILNVNDAENVKVKEIISDTKIMMREVSKFITYTQLRNAFQMIREDGMDFRRIQLIRPKLAYIQARLERSEGRKFMEMIDDFIELIDTDPGKSEQQIKNFQAFMESIVAYHKLNA